MGRKRHSPESIAAVLRRVEGGIPIAELARKAGVHENAISCLGEEVRLARHRRDP
jgi:transposase-like protein